MYLLRRDDSDPCPPGSYSCMPSFAITGQDPTEKDNDTTFGPTNYGEPGPHRFIGIAMVAGMIFLALTAYLVFGRRPRRLCRKYCRCLGGRKDEVVEEEASMKQVAVVLETTSSASYSSSEEKPYGSRTSNSTRVAQGDADSRSKSRRKQSSRGRSRSKHGKSSRPVYGSVVHVAKDTMDVNGEPGNMIPGWEVEHIHGVRYEVSCSRYMLFSVPASIG